MAQKDKWDQEELWSNCKNSATTVFDVGEAIICSSMRSRADAVFLHCAHSATTAFVDALIEATTTTT